MALTFGYVRGQLSLSSRSCTNTDELISKAGNRAPRLPRLPRILGPNFRARHTRGGLTSSLDVQLFACHSLSPRQR
jgi:hypothetical protein